MTLFFYKVVELYLSSDSNLYLYFLFRKESCFEIKNEKTRTVVIIIATSKSIDY